jgi:hypothetical protein
MVSSHRRGVRTLPLAGCGGVIGPRPSSALDGEHPCYREDLQAHLPSCARTLGLVIDPKTVTAVLLVDGWHHVDPSASPGFEMVNDGWATGGEAEGNPLSAFLMSEVNVTATVFTGSLSSILAVRCKAEKR